MNPWRLSSWAGKLLVILCILGSGLAPAENVPAVVPPNANWPFPVSAAQRPGTYWWCPGSAFSTNDIDYNLERFREAGFGFVHIIPIYGARGAEERYIPYLSPRWMEMLGYTVRKAQALGLFVDMTTGTGWCFGGPNLPIDAIDARGSYDVKTHTLKLEPGMKVKRAAPGGEGPMINPFSPRSMRLYLERFSKAFAESKEATPRAQYHDSFEYKSDWCPELLDEFKARKGYDLREHLPGFFARQPSGDPDRLARVKGDYREVLSDLHRESIQAWTQWAHERGMLTRDQAHGAPANLLDVYATSDIPETEMFGAPEFPVPGFRRDPEMVREGDSDARICMLASSAAHVAHAPGHQLVSSESCTWMREHWHETLAQIKLELDLFFLAGVNQMLFHGSCYSPKDAPWPGWFFYAATKMDWRNSIWRDVPYLCDYVGRCQSVLQSGQPANDVLVYWPIHDLWMDPKGTTIRLTVHQRDWMAGQRIGQVANLLLSKGYAFDFVSDRMIESLKVKNGNLSAPGGSYRAIVVPACRYMPEGTLKCLADLSEVGIPIIFEQELPSDVPGLAELQKRRSKFPADAERLKKSAIIAADTAAGLERVGVSREMMAEAGLRFIRRKAGDSYWYFIANHGAKTVESWIPLGVPGVSATLFDPMTGNSGRLSSRSKGTVLQVYLQLAAGETAILQTDSKERAVAAWTYLKPTGSPAPLRGEWSIEFIEGGPELPIAYKTMDLTSWTTAGDVRAQAFAGTARYTLRFTAPQLAEGEDWFLDLGEVRESGRVRLNGQQVSTLFALPFRTRVGIYLKPGLNTLEVEVTNLSANRVRDLELRKVDWKIMKDANIISVNSKNFDPAHWKLEDSGLLGPVTLVPMRRFIPSN